MSLASLAAVLSQPAIRSRFGRIGVDVGAHAIKLAQVERIADSWRYVGRWVVERCLAAPATDATAGSDSDASVSLTDVAVEMSHVRGMFHTMDVAAALPASVVEIRAFELPPAADDELDAMVREEMASDTESLVAPCCDWWRAGKTRGGDESIYAAMVSRSVVERLWSDLDHIGYDLHQVDALPCAMARAAAMDHRVRGRPTLAIDLGVSTATAALVEDGVPLFVRQIRHGGLHSIARPLSESLGCTPLDAARLLTRPVGQRVAAVSAIGERVRAPLEAFAAELRRTIAYVDQRFPQHAPQELCALGAGALVAEVLAAIEDAVEVPTHPWRLGDGSSGDRTEPLLGVAAALSALEWEGTS